MQELSERQAILAGRKGDEKIWQLWLKELAEGSRVAPGLPE